MYMVFVFSLPSSDALRKHVFHLTVFCTTEQIHVMHDVSIVNDWLSSDHVILAGLRNFNSNTRVRCLLGWYSSERVANCQIKGI